MTNSDDCGGVASLSTRSLTLRSLRHIRELEFRGLSRHCVGPLRVRPVCHALVEDVLMQALKTSPAPDEKGAGLLDEKSSATGAELVEAMQASPFKEIGLEPGRERMPVRDAGF